MEIMMKMNVIQGVPHTLYTFADAHAPLLNPPRQIHAVDRTEKNDQIFKKITMWTMTARFTGSSLLSAVCVCVAFAWMNFNFIVKKKTFRKIGAQLKISNFTQNSGKV